jgi:molybdenum cofactor biosynthesis enzyme MoaA
MDAKKFYNEQLEMLAVKDVAKIVETHYNDDAQMLLLTGDEPMIANGKEEIFKLFSGYLEYVFRGFISTEKFVSNEDSLFFEATIDTVNGHVRVYDAMYLRDGKILRHFSGIIK